MSTVEQLKPPFNTSSFYEHTEAQPATWQEKCLTADERRKLYQMLLYIKNLIKLDDSIYAEPKKLLDNSTTPQNYVRNQYIQFFDTVQNPNNDIQRGKYISELNMVKDFYSRLKDMYVLQDSILNQQLKKLTNIEYPANVYFLKDATREIEEKKSYLLQEKGLHLLAITRCSQDIRIIDRIINPPEHSAKIIDFPALNR